MSDTEKSMRETMEEVYDRMTEEDGGSESVESEMMDAHDDGADHADVTATSSDDYAFEDGASYEADDELGVQEEQTFHQAQAPHGSDPQFKDPNFQNASYAPDPGVWAPYLQEVGIPADQAFQILLQTEYSLRHGTPEQKRNAILGIMSEYGIDIGYGVPSAQQHAPTPIRDPAVPYLEQQFGTLLQLLRDQKRSDDEARLATTRQSINALRNSHTAGQLDYPYFDQVRSEMASIVKSGGANSLSEAYQMAVRANPTTRQLLEKSERRARRTIAHERAQKAKKTSRTNVLPSAIPGGPKAPKTMRETMEEVYDRMTS